MNPELLMQALIPTGKMQAVKYAGILSIAPLQEEDDGPFTGLEIELFGNVTKDPVYAIEDAADADAAYKAIMEINAAIMNLARMINANAPAGVPV